MDLKTKHRYFIRYTVDGFAGEHRAGPYLVGEELDYQRSDLLGFEGVKYLGVELAEDTPGAG